jgi:hypothetical protein
MLHPLCRSKALCLQREPRAPLCKSLAPKQRLIRLELAFLHHPLMLLAFAFDAVLIIAFAVRELPNHFIEAAGCVLIKIAAAQADSLPATKFMDHMKLRSRAHLAHGHPIVAAGGAQPLMVNELLGRDGRKPTAQSMSTCCRPDIGRDFRSRSSALEQCSNAAASGDQSHERCRSDMPGSRLCSFARREHNRSLCHRRPDQKPMMLLRWVTQSQIASFFS